MSLELATSPTRVGAFYPMGPFNHHSSTGGRAFPLYQTRGLPRAFALGSMWACDFKVLYIIYNICINAVSERGVVSK